MTRNISMTSASSEADDVRDDHASKRGARNRLVIFLLLISVFVMILNETIMGVALPTLTKDLGVAPSTAQWLTAAVLLTVAVVIPITGFLLQRFHTRPLFILVLPVAVAALVVGASLVSNVTDPRPTRVDVISVALSALGFGGVVFGCSR